jgi:hypothetical protein
VSKAPLGILDFVKFEALSDTDSSAVLHTVFPPLNFWPPPKRESQPVARRIS